MTKPESFILTTDYATLKNDGTGTTAMTVPASMSIAAGATYSQTADLTIGSAGASERAQIHSSLLNKRYIGNILSVQRSGVSSGSSSSYNVAASISRTSATTLQAKVEVRNPYSASLTTHGAAETFTFYINTFIPPNS